MRRILAVLLCLVLLIPAGCTNQGEEARVGFYYPRQEFTYGSIDGMIAREPRPDVTDQSAIRLLSLYFEGPVDAQFVNPFPEGLTVTDVHSDGHTLYITVSDHMARLSGAPLITACACLAKTGMSLVGTQAAYIRCETLLLDGKKGIAISDDTAFFYDDSSAPNQAE